MVLHGLDAAVDLGDRCPNPTRSACFDARWSRHGQGGQGMVRANRFCESLSCSASACIGRAGGADQLEIASCVDRASRGTRKGFFDDKVRVVKVVKGNK